MATKQKALRESIYRPWAIAYLEAKGWQCWYPPYSQARRGKKTNDIWGVFDLECLKTGMPTPLYVQLTVMSRGSMSNVNARIRKIQQWAQEGDFSVQWVVLAWHPMDERFYEFGGV